MTIRDENGTSCARPTRIELPTDAPRQKLHVRRPQTSGAESSERAYSAIAQVEARANAEQRRKRVKQFKACVNNVVALLVLAGIGFVGYKAYRIWKGYDEKVELPSFVEDIVDKLRKE